MTAKKTKSKKKASASTTYLEKLVSKTKKFKVEELLDLYEVYDQLVVEFVFKHLLFPYTRFARNWLRDQARDLLAGTDRNRLILTSRYRKATEEEWENIPVKERRKWAETIKPKHTKFLFRVMSMLNKYDDLETVMSSEEIESLGVSRLVYDDMAVYFTALMNSYPQMVADYCAALADGDHEAAAEIDCFLRCLETEVGIKRDTAWYVVVNTRSIYDQIEKMVQSVTMAYARLLFRFSHRLRGVTSTDDNFSAGYEGMMRAARNYDPVDGSSFTAHCQWWVRSAVLQRQRQSSVIVLPAATWYQLGQLQRGQISLSDDRVSDLKARAEMFYANSSNANRGQDQDDDADVSFESIHVTSPDASVVMGDSVTHAQSVEEGYEDANTSITGRRMLDEAIDILHDEDPALIFPVVLWAMNSGIDAAMMADIVGPSFVSEEDINTEKSKHQEVKRRVDEASKVITLPV